MAAEVWIDGGLHANESVNAQALFTETYEFLNRTDAEMMRILNDDILLLVPINPDGMELVANWYMRNFDPKERTLNGLPRLYQKYVGQVASKLLPAADQPDPIGPLQEWHQRQSIDYLITADMAILDIASKMREDFLFRIYRAGKNSIERGNEDPWTITPKNIAAMEAAYAKDTGRRVEAATAEGDNGGGGGGGRGGMPVKYWTNRTRRKRAIREAISSRRISRIFSPPPNSWMWYTSLQVAIMKDRHQDDSEPKH